MNTIEENSILISTKKLAGIDKVYDVFDLDIVTYINSIFMTLNQLGVGPEAGFAIENDSAEWSDFIKDNVKLNAVKTYMYLKVKLLFDPPLSSSVVESMNHTISELEWRLNVAVDPGDS